VIGSCVLDIGFFVIILKLVDGIPINSFVLFDESSIYVSTLSCIKLFILKPPSGEG
jgi:hypothetical protein